MSASTPISTHEDYESFEEAEYDDGLIVRDAQSRIWIAFETDAGYWYAVRPRDEDDKPGPDGDTWRPVGLDDIEHLPYPLRCVRVNAVLDSAPTPEATGASA